MASSSQHSRRKRLLTLIFSVLEKVFDNLNWICLFTVLKYINLGYKFIKWASSIYISQKKQIIVNGELTNPCMISKGTRQGCPVFPLLLILVLEVLNRDIR